MAQKTIDFDNDILKPIGSLKRDLADLDNNKITKFYTNNNGDTVLNDSDDGKIQDLMIYGKSEQKQYKGTNLAIIEYQRTPIAKGGVTFTMNDDGTVTLNGTSTADNIDFYLCGSWSGSVIVNLDADKDYTIRAMPIEGIGMLFGTNTRIKSVGKTDVHTKGMPLAFIFIRILKAGSTYNNIVIYPQINEGKTVLDYEPYTGGKPSPSPEYPQEIKAVVNPVIKTHGKNLLKATLQTNTQNGVTCINNGDGTYTLNGIATALIDMALSANFHIENGKKYRMTGWVKNVSGFIYIINGKGDERDTGNGVTFTYNDATNDSKVIYIQVPKGAIINNVIIKPMICTDTTATYDDFKPYQETQATLPYELYAIPVSSGGNVTIDGQQYIADYVDVERGKLVRMTELIEYDGTENWILQSINNNGIANFQTIATRCIGNIGMCDTLQLQKTLISNTNTEGFMINNDNTLFIRINTTRGISTLETFKEFLANKHIFILYALSTPTEIDLVKEEITAFKALSTYYPKTYVDAESEQLEAYTMFNYPVSMEKGWEYVKQQIGDTRKYVYDMDLQSAEAYVNSEYAVALTELEV